MQIGILALKKPFLLVALLAVPVLSYAKVLQKDSSSRDFSATAFGQLSTAPPTETKEEPAKKVFKKASLAPTGLLNQPQGEITETLRGINLLVSKSNGQQELPKLLLNRAMTSFSLARRKLLDSKKLKMDETENRLLKIALSDCAKVLKAPGIGENMLARAHYIRGLIFIYSDNPAGASGEFIKSLEIDPASENAGWMGLNIAEQYFEDGQYKTALNYYSKFLKRIEADSVDLARYKMAWCYINLGQQDNAVKVLLSIVARNVSEGFVKDSLKDVAFLLSTSSSEARILEISDKKLTRKADKVEFLSAVMRQLELQNVVRLQSKVLTRLLQLEEDPLKKLQYLLAGMRTSRKGYASLDHYNSFVKIREFLAVEKLESNQEIEAARSSLDQEAQFLMKSFLETFSGKIRSPEALPKAKVAQGLKNLFGFYERYFKQSKLYNSILSLWINVCYEMEDWKCVDLAADKIQNIPALNEQHKRVAVDQLLALEQIHKDDKDSLDSRVEEKFRDFLKVYPQATQWVSIATRFADLYMKVKDYDKSIDVLDQIFEHERNGESLYQLMRVRFDLKKYKNILSDTRAPSKQEDARVADLKRESALRLAIEAKKASNDEDYKKYLTQYLRLNPPLEKIALVRKEFLGFLISKQEYPAALEEFLRIPESMRCKDELNTECLRLWKALMLRGQFVDARSIFPKTAPARGARVYFQNLLSTLASPGRKKMDEIFLLNPSEKEYVIGLLALLEPDTAVKVLGKKSALLAEGKAVPWRLLALRLKQGEWDIEANPESLALLGRNYKFAKELLQAQMTRTDAIQNHIQVPLRKFAPKQLQRASEDVVSSVNKMRAQLQKDVALKIALQDKQRILQKAKKIEEEVAAFIRLQDIPSGLTEVQAKEYADGVENLAKGYEVQAGEWAKISEQVSAAMGNAEKAREAESVSLELAEDYPWPDSYKSDANQFLRTQVEASNYLGALIMLDLAKDPAVKNMDDYYRVRTGLLLSASSSVAMRHYVVQELKGAGQNGLLAEFQKMEEADAPTPSESAPAKAKAPVKEKAPDKDLQEGDLENDL